MLLLLLLEATMVHGTLKIRESGIRGVAIATRESAPPLPGINDGSHKRRQRRLAPVTGQEIDFLGYNLDTSEYTLNLNTCWSANPGYVDYLESAFECQVYCTLSEDCNTWAYRDEYWYKRCHLCADSPATNWPVDCNEGKTCSHYGQRLSVSASQFAADLVDKVKLILNDPASYGEEELDHAG